MLGRAVRGARVGRRAWAAGAGVAGRDTLGVVGSAAVFPVKTAPVAPIFEGVAARAMSTQYGARAAPVNLGVVVVPQQSAYVVERFGSYSRTLEPGIHFLIPVMDRIAYVHDLRERVVNVPNQTAITSDNVTIQCDGVLYVQIKDPYHASYGVSDPVYAVAQLAQTTMRSELGKITLDKTFEERESLNHNIVYAVNEAAQAWGITCLRYEIRDITPPPAVKAAMDLQAEAERRKRAEILESEGERESAVNSAEGQRRSTMLKAQGDAAAVVARAEAAAKGIERLASAILAEGGREAVSLRVAEQYVAAFARIAKRGNTILLPSNAGDPAAMVAQAVSIYDSVRKTGGSGGGAAGAGGDEVYPEDDDVDTHVMTEDIGRSVSDSVGHSIDDTMRAISDSTLSEEDISRATRSVNKAIRNAAGEAEDTPGSRPSFAPKPF